VPSCGVPVGRSWGAGTHSRLGSSRRWSWRVALWVVQFVLCFLLICIVVVTVPFVCCSVKLPLSLPTSFCLFLSILLHTPVGGGVAVWRFCYWPQPNQNKSYLKNIWAILYKQISDTKNCWSPNDTSYLTQSIRPDMPSRKTITSWFI